ncbi:MAG: energy transducer TonB, partial [Muribaculaceae bacterium]|nr:energy transducer TonB [Muribaculaceae bacterium]
SADDAILYFQNAFVFPDNIADSLPQFPGGNSELLNFIYQNINYPIKAKQWCIQRRVITAILIKEDGTIGDAKIVKSINEELDEEALRIVRTLPKFKPAIYDGKPVEYWFLVPVNFKLPD